MRADVRNIGIFAHVDAGKTTLSEQLLLTAHEIRSPGAVDAGTAHTDRLAVEKRRGISVKTACAPLTWKGVSVRLIDTPGHADFSSEIDRGMWAIDGAVIVVSGTDGVQPQTEALFRSLSKHRIPILFFVNKLDRPNADFASALGQVRSLLSPRAFDLSDDSECMAAIAEEDDEALSAYMDGTVWVREALLSRIAPCVSACALYPVLGGSALTGKGVPELLDAVTSLLPAPEGDENAPLSGVVFAVETDPVMGRAAWTRLFSGKLRNRDTIEMRVFQENEYGRAETAVERKITQIRALSPNGRGEDTGAMRAGDICAVYGLGDVKTGQTLGDKTLLPARVSVNNMRPPLFMAKAEPENPDDLPALKKALEQLSAEDPLLDVTIIQRTLNVRLMGAIQIEVLEEELRTRFGIPVHFSAPEVVYRETIKKTSVGFVAYTMPKPCWAVIQLEISPAPRGSGVTFESCVSPRDIKYRYQHQIESAIPIATRQGMLGWQVDDVHICLTGGGDHEIHTHPLDFIVATPMAFMDGLNRGGSALLEPILELELTIEDVFAGKIMGEINAMRGSVLDTRANVGKRTLVCEAPAAECADFPMRFSRMTAGRGIMSSRLKCYRECDLSLGKTCPRQGVHPLDTSKYILAARNALDGAIFG